MIIKCKMCGGDILFDQGDSVGRCDHCGSSCTIPKVDEEQKLNRYNRANHFRRQCEFDKAVAAYEKILEEDDTDAEAHWGVVISRFGIEYVEDPATGKRIPTCHRVQLTSILADEDYKAAVQYAPDSESRRLYEEEAARIAEIQRSILAISQNERPYDVFICYKETDENGQRTHDSQWAQDIYYGLTEQGYKVFFSRITLEDKLGQEYEPYIFAALQSARVMVAVGSKPEYFNAVWVKNEWSRYLALMAHDRKRVLIPCYRGMDPYDLPDELSSLQSQDMSKIGFMQDLIRGIQKVLEADKKAEQPKVIQQEAQTAASETATPGVASLMKRIGLFLEDGDFRQASVYIDRVLDIDPEYAPAYAAKVCVAFDLRKEADLAETTFQYEDNPDWQKALRFADPQQKAVYESYAAKVRERVACQIRNYAFDCAVEMAVVPNADRGKLETELVVYRNACTHSTGKRADGSRRPGSQAREDAFNHAVKTNEPGDVSESSLKIASAMFAAIGDDEASERAEQCKVLAEQARQKAIYLYAAGIQHGTLCDPSELEEAARLFLTVPDYKDAREQAQACIEAAEGIRAGLYSDAVQAIESSGNESRKWEETKKKLADSRLNGFRDISALRTQAAQKYEDALAGEEEARRQAEELARRKAEAEARKKKWIKIISALAVVAVVAIFFLVTRVIIPEINYRQAKTLQQAGKYEEAITAFKALNGFSDSAVQITETKYLQAKALTAKGDYAEAATIMINLKGYKDVDTLLETDDNLATGAREVKFALCKETGSIVTFGTYPQTEEGTDQTPIEWIVLDYDKANHKALLISRYGLDAVSYNKEYTAVTWEQCTLRGWLNGEFLKKAFSAKEKSAILVTNVDNSSNQGYRGWKDGGGNTQDRVFLLSYAEANRYLSVTYEDNNTKSRVAPTAYAIARGAGISDSNQTADGMPAGWWWLRSPGYYQSSAACVFLDGSLICNGVDRDYGVARPAFWLNLESDIF